MRPSRSKADRRHAVKAAVARADVRAPFVALIILSLLLGFPALCIAGVNYQFGLESGGTWFFLYDKAFESVVAQPQVCYGAYFNVISDFEWARNISLELSYLRSEGDGLIEPVKKTAKIRFHMISDRESANVAYFFGGAVYDPYISGGLGSAHIEFQPQGRRAEDDWDFAVNVGGGVDFKLGKYFLLGGRLRYTWILPSGTLVKGHVSSLDTTLRVSLRF